MKRTIASIAACGVLALAAGMALGEAAPKLKPQSPTQGIGLKRELNDLNRAPTVQAPEIKVPTIDTPSLASHGRRFGDDDRSTGKAPAKRPVAPAPARPQPASPNPGTAAPAPVPAPANNAAICARCHSDGRSGTAPHKI